ncbi:DUF819 family protein [Psychrobacter sp. FDAARGOS_221]|uniref:DUF819 family protein n=1 Tax=Psychrobacter sp. FDAARGOS_221 TaxID=1975705 RepID=UPI000BB56941|nr:DUF819 family protein [Psychrobacter sp. FDAARGOS_221]PNK60821.1 DUF819 domain-containing protein [Psychrobacter sp. FDAARGOS_221]
MTAIYGIILLIVPIILIALAQRFYWLDKIGVVILAFVSGLLFSVGYQPTDASLSTELLAVKTQVSEVAIAVAIPLLLFSINIPASIRLAGSAVKAMLLACLGMCLATLVTSLMFQQQVTHIWQAAGMMVGAYTGGGQNIGAVKAAINADPSLFVDMLTYDIIISALYLLSAMTILKPIASKFLTPFVEADKPKQGLTTQKQSHSQQLNAEYTDTSADDFDHLTEDGASMFTALTHRSTLAKLIVALLLAAACIGLSLAVSELFTSPMQSAITIICLTTLGAALSFIPSIRKLTLSYPLGMFFIIVFCFASGSMADLSVVTEIKWGLFGYISSSLLLAIVLHGLLCKLFKVDADTFVITGSAAIMSVPFIPMIASSINNKALLFPGIAAGVMGYVLGNYLGIAMAYLVLGML